MQNINDMLVFSEVVKAGSFTKAADQLGLPKSNISRKINRLESQLGVRLIERTTRRIHLTQIGEIYLSHCQRIAEEVESSLQCVEHMSAKPRGRLSICASVTLGQQIISPHLAAFLKAYPDIQVKLELTNRRVDIIEEGFDLTLRIGELEDSSLIARYLGRLSRTLCGSPELMANIPEPATPMELADLPTLLMSAGKIKKQWQFSQQGKAQTVTLSPRVQANDFLSLSHLCRQGVGIALLPSYICQPHLESGELIEVLPDWQCSGSKVFALYPSHKSVTPKVRVFITFLQQVFAKLGATSN